MVYSENIKEIEVGATGYSTFPIEIDTTMPHYKYIELHERPNSSFGFFF